MTDDEKWSHLPPPLTYEAMTVAEEEDIEDHALRGGSISALGETHPMRVMRGMMWIASRRRNPALTWDQFRTVTHNEDVIEWGRRNGELIESENPPMPPADATAI